MSPDFFQLETPLGYLQGEYHAGAIISLAIRRRPTATPESSGRRVPTCLPHRLRHDLLRYFSDPAQPLNLPLQPAGTPYQQKVWQALREIPAGSYCCYGELAARVGGSARAVGNACRANPIAIYIPCHRVLAKSGLGGYSGQTGGPQLAIKRWLLQHEGVDLGHLS